MAIIDRALCKDMAQRYQSGDEMARDLRACMQQVPASLSKVDIEF